MKKMVLLINLLFFMENIIRELIQLLKIIKIIKMKLEIILIVIKEKLEIIVVKVVVIIQ